MIYECYGVLENFHLRRLQHSCLFLLLHLYCLEDWTKWYFIYSLIFVLSNVLIQYTLAHHILPYNSHIHSRIIYQLMIIYFSACQVKMSFVSEKYLKNTSKHQSINRKKTKTVWFSSSYGKTITLQTGGFFES